MFSIRRLFFILSSVYLILLLASLLFTRWAWFYPTEVERHLESQQQELNSFNAVLDIIQQQLLSNAANYAQWSKILTIVEASDSNTAITTKNFLNLQASSIDVAIAVNRDKKPMMAVQRGDQHFLDITQNNNLNQWLLELSQSSQYFNEEPVSDTILIGDSVYFAAISPVFQPQGNQAFGWVVLLEELDTQLWQALERISQLNVQPVLPTSVENSIGLTTPLRQIRDTHQRCLFDVQQEPVLCLNLTHLHNKMPKFLDTNAVLMYGLIIFVPVFLFFLFLTQLIRPIYMAVDMLKKFDAQGGLKTLNFSYWLPIKELRDFKTTYNNLVRTALNQQRQLELLSNTDKLTNIPNRRAFDNHFQTTWNRLKRHQQSVALVIVDIDFFKSYNDFYGHPQGDSALTLLAQALLGCARRVDEIAARFGGEEFALTVFIENEFELEQFKQRLFQAISALKIPHSQSSIDANLTASAGIAWLKNSGTWLENYLADDWIKAADIALYKAKQNGRNRSETTIISEHHPFKLED